MPLTDINLDNRTFNDLFNGRDSESPPTRLSGRISTTATRASRCCNWRRFSRK